MESCSYTYFIVPTVHFPTCVLEDPSEIVGNDGQDDDVVLHYLHIAVLIGKEIRQALLLHFRNNPGFTRSEAASLASTVD